MKRIKIAQIGIGNAHAPSNFRSFVSQSELFEVKGFCLCEGDEEKYAKTRAAFDIAPRLTLDEILGDPELEAVAIESEEMHGTRYALMAARRGLHIFMDKPGGVSQSDFERLTELVRERRLAFHMGYMYRCNPAYLEAMALVESGALGSIYSVEAHMDCLNDAALRNWLAKLPGGQMYFLGCHLVDILLRVQGEPQEIIPFNARTMLEGALGEDFGMAVFKYPRGVSFIKTCAREPGGFMRRQLVICGENGTVEIQPFERYVPCIDGRDHMTSIRVTYRDDANGWTARGEARELGPYNRYDGMTAAFAREIRGEAENPYTPAYEALLHRTLLKACGAAADG